MAIQSLFERLNPYFTQNHSEINPNLLLDLFLHYIYDKKLTLYPAQEEAILELYTGKNVILATPTGSGKSLVALALHFYALASRKRSIYTCPIKALVNEKFFNLCAEFGPKQVGIITGDSSVNPQAPILCCTAEILSNKALRQGNQTSITDVIMDEFHYYGDKERGISWQIPLLELPQVRFLLMSATLGETFFFQRCLTKLNGKKTEVIYSSHRPVPLQFEYSEIPLQETILKLLNLNRSPIYLVNFTQRECFEEAQSFLSIDFCTKAEKKTIQAQIETVVFSSPYGKEFQKLIKHGIGIHHAGILPKYRILVERLAQKGLLKIICGTDTLGVGVNIPIKTVVFKKLCKFDGEKTKILSIRDFHQISGRAGRKGFDEEGFVIAQAPEHIIENLKIEQKKESDSKKTRKLLKRKPPEKGFVLWNKETFEKLISEKPEILSSQFKVSHAMLLSVLSRTHEDGCKAMQKLIRNCHENDLAKKQHRKTAFQFFRSLVQRKIIQLGPLRIDENLQKDFSLHHTLSLYLIDTLAFLDTSSLDYDLELISLVEAILENPEPILRKQLDRIKSEKMDALKAEGFSYEERIQELEKLEYPKPNANFFYKTFNHFSDQHPWIGEENIKPKSIARQMLESFQSFSEYVSDYKLHRYEGLLLRYLSEVYKVLTQTIPESFKNQKIHAMIHTIATLVKQTDASLIEEWEKLKDLNKALNDDKNDKLLEPLFDKKRFTIQLRNEIFKIIRSLAQKDYETTMNLLQDGKTGWTKDLLESKMIPYYYSKTEENHFRICTDTKARDPKHTFIEEKKEEEGAIEKEKWLITQVLIDPDEHNDWALQFSLDLKLSHELCKPILILEAIGPIESLQTKWTP